MNKLLLLGYFCCQDMADITTPLKQFTDAVLAQEAAARKKEMVNMQFKEVF